MTENKSLKRTPPEGNLFQAPRRDKPPVQQFPEEGKSDIPPGAVRVTSHQGSSEAKEVVFSDTGSVLREKGVTFSLPRK